MVALRGLMINRLIVLLQVFVFPTYFYLLTFLGPMKDMTLDNFFFWGRNPLSETAEFVILKIAAPLLYSLPFVLVSIVRANRIADSYTLMWRALGKVRIDTKLFYMVNALFCLFLFILPVAGPIIAVFGAFFAVKLFLILLGYKGHIPPILIVIPGLFLAAIPLMVTIAFFISYQTVLTPIISFWALVAPSFYGLVLCLACSMAIGNFFILVSEGSAKVSYSKGMPPQTVILIKSILFVIFLLIYILVAKWDSTHIALLIINVLAVVLSLFDTFVRWKKNMTRDSGGGGTAMVPVFIAINFLANYWKAAITVVVGIAGALFFGLFLLAYKYATDETLFD